MQFGRVTIIGVGLLGASLGLALKARGLAGRITGVGRRQSSLDKGLAAGAIDEAALDVRAAVVHADLIVLATPAAEVMVKLDEIRGCCPRNACITDVASTKGRICAHAAALWPVSRRFVGAHPMAGSEKFGPEHGRADLYEGSICLVEDSPDIDPDAREIITALWRAVGAETVAIDAQCHDAMLARTSHIPHVLAASIATLAARQGDVRQLIGNGYRDMTRIAASRPEVWRDITMTNREAILEGLDELQHHLDSFARALREEDAGAIEAFYNEGSRARRNTVPE